VYLCALGNEDVMMDGTSATSVQSCSADSTVCDEAAKYERHFAHLNEEFSGFFNDGSSNVLLS